jgi:hypothetical protein
MSEGETAVPTEEAPAVTEQPAEQPVEQPAEQPAAQPAAPKEDVPIEHPAPVEQPPVSQMVPRHTLVTHTVQHQHFQEEFVQEQATLIEKWPPLPRDNKVVGTEKLEVSLSKEEGQSWGFRLGGGKEFGMPLSVIRVRAF